MRTRSNSARGILKGQNCLVLNWVWSFTYCETLVIHKKTASDFIILRFLFVRLSIGMKGGAARVILQHRHTVPSGAASLRCHTLQCFTACDPEELHALNFAIWCSGLMCVNFMSCICNDHWAQVLICLTVNGVVGTVLSDLLWARAVSTQHFLYDPLSQLSPFAIEWVTRYSKLPFLCLARA